MNVNFRYVEEELRYLFDNSDIVAIVYQREYGPLIAAARDAQPQLQHFIRIEWDGSDADDSRARPDRVSKPRSRPDRPTATSASAPTTTSTCSTPAAPRACPRA